jgi:hypothetical protein
VVVATHGAIPKLDKEYIARMEDVLKTYERPLSESQPVVCVDEKPILLHEDTQPSIPIRTGLVARRDYESGLNTVKY